jgi:class 3 adenylate cyclase/pimeloyl-ACP methyl ester carboxylesterase
VERLHPDIRFTTTEDGAAIAFWEIGEGKPVVLIQNFSLTHAEWEWEVSSIASFYTDMAERYRVVRFDWRGIGLSGDRPGGWESPLSTGELCLDIEAVVAAIGLESFALLATSIACPVGIEFAATHPDLVSELILCQGFASVASSHIVVAMRTEQEIAKYESETGQAFHSIWERVFPEDDLEPVRRMNRLVWARTGGGPTGRQEWDSEPLLEQIAVPTLVISSPIPDEAVRDARNLAAGISGSQLRIIEGAGSPVLTDRKATLDVINGFLEPDSPVTQPIPGGFRTVVFTDIVDSTKFMGRVGDEEGRTALRAVEEHVSSLADQHGGRVIKNLGDGSLVAFGSNTAALRFALAVQKDADPDSLQLRVGMAAGEPIEEGGDIHGAVVAYASRIADLGEAGEIVASDTVRQLAMGKGFGFTPMGQFELKGFEEPATVWRVGSETG